MNVPEPYQTPAHRPPTASRAVTGGMLHRLASAFVVDATFAQTRWKSGQRYPGTVPVEAVEQTLADHLHAVVAIGTLRVAAWMEGRTVRLATMTSSGTALTARCCDLDSIDRLKRWTASRLQPQLLH